MRFNFKNLRLNFTILLTIVIMTLVSANLNWNKNHWTGIVGSDGKGYYAYLPAMFIYKDLNFGFFDKIEKQKYYNVNRYYDYRSGSNGKVINKYYCGTAIAEMPFFLIAHTLSHVLGYDTDGYSFFYAISVSIAALFYLFVGLYYLNATLKTYDINKTHRNITIVASVFGTHLFYYVVGEPSMSHIFSFAFISMFYYFGRKYFSTYQQKNIILLGLLLGLITLIRPINGLIVLALPFVAGNFEALKNGIIQAIRNKWSLIISVFVFFAVFSIQLIIYKISTGSFFVYAYGEEKFHFFSPHIVDILFSYKKGLFLYTPLLFLALIGGYFLWKHSRFQFFAWFGFFFLITYIFSSWWMWYYGGSFSSRVYVEFIPLFMILLAISLKKITPILLKRLYVSAIVLLIVICQIQTYQYRYYQIHWSDMTKEKYWNVFLRIDKLIK